MAGPLATQILGDYGAEVIKVEHPQGGDDSRQWAPPRAPDGQASYFFAVNRGKRSITIDLKHPRGKALVLDLVRRGDVLVENFKPGHHGRPGSRLGDAAGGQPAADLLRDLGLRRDRPLPRAGGYDAIMQGFTGLMSITGEADGPPVKVGVALIDAITALYAHGAVLAALRHRERTGEGQYLELSLMECGIAALINAATAYLVGGEVQGRWGQRAPVPGARTRRSGRGTATSWWAPGNERLWKAFCEVLGAPEWADDPRYDANAKRVALPGRAGARRSRRDSGRETATTGSPGSRRRGSRRAPSTTSARSSRTLRCATGGWLWRWSIRRPAASASRGFP